jgi:protoheme IX farnesyltransferase
MVTVLRDLSALTKPSITRMGILTAAGGLALAGGSDLATMVAALIGTGLAIGSANALNMWWERGPDQMMSRTKDRPVAAGRLSPPAAMAFGVVIGLASLVLLALGVNLLTAALAAFALVSYVLVYTPLKYRTPLALLIGAVPGAIPPLMGWTAATGSLDAPGLALFGILLLWQLPHFLAISIYRQSDYARAGIRIVPIVRGVDVAQRQAVAWATALLPLSLVLTPLGVTGTLYLVVASVAGAAYLGVAIQGLRTARPARSARQLFVASLLYLPVVTVALAIDVIA